VAGKEETGGLVGLNATGLVFHSYYDKDTTGQEDTGKGEPRSTAEMQLRSTYSQWDFFETWVIEDKAGYPLLRW